jgi:hypothetical protein
VFGLDHFDFEFWASFNILCQPGFSRLPFCHQFQLVEGDWEREPQRASARFSLWPSGNPSEGWMNPRREARLKTAESDGLPTPPPSEDGGRHGAG